MLSRDFSEFIELLNAHDVRYLVVGGYAVAVHGYPRYTKDLDIWLEISPQNAAKVLNVLGRFGFGSLGLSTEDLLEPAQIIQLGCPPTRIDLLTSLDEISFNDCYDSKLIVTIEGVKINFIDLENLKRNKRATGRSQDLADIENLSG